MVGVNHCIFPACIFYYVLEARTPLPATGMHRDSSVSIYIISASLLLDYKDIQFEELATLLEGVNNKFFKVNLKKYILFENGSFKAEKLVKNVVKGPYPHTSLLAS